MHDQKSTIEDVVGQFFIHSRKGRILSENLFADHATEIIEFGGYTAERWKLAYYIAGILCGLRWEFYLTQQKVHSSYRVFRNKANYELDEFMLKAFSLAGGEKRSNTYFSVGGFNGKFPQLQQAAIKAGFADYEKIDGAETHWLSWITVEKDSNEDKFFFFLEKELKKSLEDLYPGYDGFVFFDKGKNGVPFVCTEFINLVSSKLKSVQYIAEQLDLSLNIGLKEANILARKLKPALVGAASLREFGRGDLTCWHPYYDSFSKIAFDVSDPAFPKRISDEQKRDILRSNEYTVFNHECIKRPDLAKNRDVAVLKFLTKNFKTDEWKSRWNDEDYINHCLYSESSERVEHHHVIPRELLSQGNLPLNDINWLVPLTSSDHKLFANKKVGEFPKVFVDMGVDSNKIDFLLRRCLLALKNVQQSIRDEGIQGKNLYASLSKKWNIEV